MEVFKNAKWIWVDEQSAPDTYGEFYKEIVWQGEKAICRISCDSDYTLFVNGQVVSSGQYGDFEWYKSYDSVDITPYLQEGKNVLAILVWHFGKDTQRYLKAPAGLIFEVEEGGQVCVESDESVLSRYSLAYKNGLQKLITRQLGFSYFYDATKEDNWTNGEGVDFTPSVVVEKNCSFVSRPVKKADILPAHTFEVITNKDNKFFVVDLGEEELGLLTLSFVSKAEQKIVVTYGENLQDGLVRRYIDARDFSVEYVAKEGQNEYTNYMLRLAGRYLQIECEAEIELAFATLLPQVYPATVKPFVATDKNAEDIYQMCLNSLRLCMMEHYVDCPWREQCLYAFDSRNQMLCGYYAFEDGNYEYARANLLLMSKDRHEGGLMSICYPCGVNLTIPSFSLHYTVSVKEYIEHSGDTSLAAEVAPRIKEFLDTILARKGEDGLLYRFEGAENWNFYDWSPHLEGQLYGSDTACADAQLNILTVMALRRFKEICALAGLEYPYGDTDLQLEEAIVAAFYNEEKQAFSVTVGGDEYVEAVNALAVVAGIATGIRAKIICQKLMRRELIPCSLSFKCFTYDALLKTDLEKYRAWILLEIRKDYKKMLESGSTATWETEDGAAAFDNAGSLCHGWTAIPIYYFKKLNVVK